jgi:hypothetical protein
MENILENKYNTARRLMNAMGHKVSAGSWIDEEIGRYYICSVKTVGQYNHPAKEIMGTEKGEYITM